MAVPFALSRATLTLMRDQQQQQIHSTVSPVECTCGAQTFKDNKTQHRQRRLLKRVAHADTADATLLSAVKKEMQGETSLPQPQDDDGHGQAEEPTRTHKRSLWRKMLGKGPKCICAQLATEREPKRPKPIAIPSEYVGCVSVRVAGRQVAYTREMQLMKRRSYTPMDVVSEASEMVEEY